MKSELKSKKQMCVLVFGESVDRNHMGLYGYEYQTTPNFYTINNELEIFKNVKATYNFTITLLMPFVNWMLKMLLYL